MLVCLLACPLARADSIDALHQRLVEADEKRFVAETLDRLEAENTRKGEMYLNDWVLHPAGIAFRVPDGYGLVGRYRGTTFLMVDEGKKNTSFQTNISISISPEDKNLARLTYDNVKSAYASQFSKFSLVNFENKDCYGEEGVCLSFLSGDSPQLLVQQCIFNKNGQYFVLTMTVENRLFPVMEGLAAFDKVLASMTFCTGTRP